MVILLLAYCFLFARALDPFYIFALRFRLPMDFECDTECGAVNAESVNVAHFVLKLNDTLVCTDSIEVVV